MENQHYQVIVIGGGPAGVTAALRARELGARVALVERGHLGGTCMNDGVAPTRVLAHAARLLRDTNHFHLYGLDGERPQLSWPRLLERSQAMIIALHDKKHLTHHLQRAGVDVYKNLGDAAFADGHNLLLGDGTCLSADKFIICTGGHSRHIEYPGVEHALTHSQVWKLEELPPSIAIVGGAATGCQFATCLNAFGVKVTVLEVSDRILTIEDPAVSQEMEKAFSARGIDIVHGIGGVKEIVKTDGGLELKYLRKEQTETLPVAAVLMAVGWVGNVDTLNLAGAGVTTERGRITVNDFLQTSVPHIFAAGDVTGRMMLVQSASDEGRAAAENAVMGVGQPNRHRIVPHGGFTDPEYASVGLTEEKARALGPIVVGVVPYADADRAVIDARPEGICKLIVSQETHRILGAQVVGEQALEIIQLVAAGMVADMWVEQLAEMEIAYPTYAAVVGLAARRIAEDLGVIPVSSEWHSLGVPPAEFEDSLVIEVTP